MQVHSCFFSFFPSPGVFAVPSFQESVKHSPHDTRPQPEDNDSDFVFAVAVGSGMGRVDTVVRAAVPMIFVIYLLLCVRGIDVPFLPFRV